MRRTWATSLFLVLMISFANGEVDAAGVRTWQGIAASGDTGCDRPPASAGVIDPKAGSGPAIDRADGEAGRIAPAPCPAEIGRVDLGLTPAGLALAWPILVPGWPRAAIGRRRGAAGGPAMATAAGRMAWLQRFLL